MTIYRFGALRGYAHRVPLATALRFGGLLAALACTFGPVAARAQDTEPTVRSIRVDTMGPGPMDEDFVRMHLGFTEDDAVQKPAIYRAVRALLETGRFAKVEAVIEPADDGITVVFSIRNRLRLAEPVVVHGADYLGETKTRDLLDLNLHDWICDAVVGARTQAVLQEYRKRRFPDVSATWRIETTRPEQGYGTVRLNVKEGKRAHIKSYVFKGNDALPDSALRKAMKHPSPWAPWGWIRKYRYDPDTLEEGRIRIREQYMDQGYLDVEVDFPEMEDISTGALIATLQVREGIPYRFGAVTLTGATLFPELELWRRVETESDAVVSESAIHRSAESLRMHYTTRGYVDTQVNVIRTAREEPGILDVRFDIREGRLTRVRNIEIQGNTRTRDKVIRRELAIWPGDVLDESRIRRSENRLRNLGFFSAVRSRTTDPLIPDNRDLIFDVEEQRTGQFMMGVGFSSIDNLMGFMEISQGNFDLTGWPYMTGGGQKLKLAAQAGDRRQRYELSFVEPWFLDRELSLGFDLYLSRVSYSDYDLERAGGAVRMARALPFASRIDLQYSLERVKIVDVADTNLYINVASGEEFLFARDEDAIKSTLTLGLTRDTRDSPFFPKRGHRVRWSGHVSGGVLGFDTDLYGMELTAAQYVPVWRGHVFSLRARAEVVDVYGRADTVPLSDRLFIGGPRTVRGFRYRGVGPKARRVDAAPDDRRHRVTGGSTLAVAGAEYSVPLVPNIRFAAFYDIGNVWEDAYDFNFDILASGAGIGIRFDIPGFPMQFDYAWALETDDDFSRKERFSFGIGYGF